MVFDGGRCGERKVLDEEREVCEELDRKKNDVLQKNSKMK